MISLDTAATRTARTGALALQHLHRERVAGGDVEIGGQDIGNQKAAPGHLAHRAVAVHQPLQFAARFEPEEGGPLGDGASPETHGHRAERFHRRTPGRFTSSQPAAADRGTSKTTMAS